MTVYLVNIALLIILGIPLIYLQPNETKRKVYCIIGAFNWIILSGFRDYSVGADTVAYGQAFDEIRSLSWGTVFQRLKDSYFGGDKKYKDPGYTFLQKVVHLFTDDYRVFLFLIAVFFTVLMAVWIYKYSKDPCLSFLVFSVVFYSFFAITGHRQTIATALVVFIGYGLIKKQKLLPFILVVLVGFTIHKSCIIMLPFYFLAHKKITPTYLVTLFAFCVATFALGQGFILEIATLFGYDYEGYQADTGTFTLLMMFMTVATIWASKQMLNNDRENALGPINAMLLAGAATVLTLREQSMMRIQQYFSLYMMIALPEILCTLSKKNRLFITMFCMLALIALLIKTSPYYKFCW